MQAAPHCDKELAIAVYSRDCGVARAGVCGRGMCSITRDSKDSILSVTACESAVVYCGR